MLLLSTCPWRENTGTLVIKRWNCSLIELCLVILAQALGNFWCLTRDSILSHVLTDETSVIDENAELKTWKLLQLLHSEGSSIKHHYCSQSLLQVFLCAASCSPIGAWWCNLQVLQGKKWCNVFRQYMNRKGGLNRPLDFIAWWSWSRYLTRLTSSLWARQQFVHLLSSVKHVDVNKICYRLQLTFNRSYVVVTMLAPFCCYVFEIKVI